MDAELQRLIAEVERWGEYQLLLFQQGKEGTPEYERVVERWLAAYHARSAYTSAPFAREFGSEQFPALGTASEPDREPPRNHAGAPPRRQKHRIELCDVRHIWPAEGVGPCVRCGVPHPRTFPPRAPKEKLDPAIVVYRAERERRTEAPVLDPEWLSSARAEIERTCTYFSKYGRFPTTPKLADCLWCGREIISCRGTRRYCAACAKKKALALQMARYYRDKRPHQTATVG